MGRVNQYYEDEIEEELHAIQDGLIKEEDLCQKLNSTQTINTISTFLSISQS